MTNAHRIREGQTPTLVPPRERGDRNCLWIEVEDPKPSEEPPLSEGEEPAPHSRREFMEAKEDEKDKAVAQIVTLVRKSLPGLGFRGDDIQVLSAMHKGTLGVAYLNERLQEALNPADPSGRRPELLRGSRRFRIGDRVIQLKNDYDKNVYNGDVGTVADIKPEDQVLLVRYPEGVVTYDFADYDELQLAYALSVHKSQGSEYKAVVLVMHSSQYMMLQRNLLYTGLTRARDMCLLVGDRRAIVRAVKNDKTTRRYTRLAERLRDTAADNTPPGRLL